MGATLSVIYIVKFSSPNNAMNAKGGTNSNLNVAIEPTQGVCDTSSWVD